MATPLDSPPSTWLCPRSSVIQNYAYIWGEPIHHLHAKSHHVHFWSKNCRQDAPHSVEAVLEDVSRPITTSEASELRCLLRHRISLNHSSPEHIEFKVNRFERRPKRRCNDCPSNELNQFSPEYIEFKSNGFERRSKRRRDDSPSNESRKFWRR